MMIIADSGSATGTVAIIIAGLAALGTVIAAVVSRRGERDTADVEGKIAIMSTYGTLARDLQADITRYRAEAEDGRREMAEVRKQYRGEVEALRQEAREARDDLAAMIVMNKFVWTHLGMPEGYDPIADIEHKFARIEAAASAAQND